jgi:hypothetical protein
MEETPLAHGCGLRQDGPLSLLLFNIVIDSLDLREISIVGRKLLGKIVFMGLLTRS